MRFASIVPATFAIACFVAGACAHTRQPAPEPASPPPVARSAPPPAAAATAGEMACAAQVELQFSRAESCVNDGSVEFCLSTSDVAAHVAVREIAPSVVCRRGSSGRARCDRATEDLCMLELAEGDCTARHGRMVDAVWDRVCRLAELEAVHHIVPTFYE